MRKEPEVPHAAMPIPEAVLQPIPWHTEPSGLACFQRQGVPLRPGLSRCTCCGANVVLPFSRARSAVAPIVPGP